MTIYSDRIIPQGKIFLCYSIGIARNIQFYIPLSIHNLSDASETFVTILGFRLINVKKLKKCLRDEYLLSAQLRLLLVVLRFADRFYSRFAQ